MTKKSSVVSHSPAAFAHSCAAQALLGHQDLNTTMICTHVLQKGGRAACSPAGPGGIKKPRADPARGFAPSQRPDQRFLRGALEAALAGALAGNSMPEKASPGQMPLTAAK